MKIVSYRVEDRETYGVVVDDSVVDLRKRLPPTHRTLRDVLTLNALDEVRNVAEGQTGDHSLDEITFLPVIPNPDKMETNKPFIRVNAKEVWRKSTPFMMKSSDG